HSRSRRQVPGCPCARNGLAGRGRKDGGGLMKKITKLTPEQEAQIPEYVNKWISIASEPMNHDLAKKHIQELYRRMGKDNPLIVIGHSPLNAALLCALFTML